MLISYPNQGGTGCVGAVTKPLGIDVVGPGRPPWNVRLPLLGDATARLDESPAGPVTTVHWGDVQVVQQDDFHS